MLNHDVKLEQGIYNEPYSHDRGYVVQNHQANHRPEDPRVHLAGNARVSDNYVVNGNAMNVSFAHGNIYNDHLIPSNCFNHDDSRYLRRGTELGNEVLHVQQTAEAGAYMHISGLENGSVRYGNHPSLYGADSVYQVPQNLAPIQSLRRKLHPSVHPGTSCESPGLMMPNGGINSGFIRGTQDGSPRYPCIGVDDPVWSMQNDAKSQKMYDFDGSAAPEYLYHHGLNVPNQAEQPRVPPPPCFTYPPPQPAPTAWAAWPALPRLTSRRRTRPRCRPELGLRRMSRCAHPASPCPAARAAPGWPRVARLINMVAYK